MFLLHPHRPSTSAHPRSLMSTEPSPHPFPTLPLHPQRQYTSAHAPALSAYALAPAPPNLLPTHFHLFPCTRACALPPAVPPAHRSFSSPISNPSLAPTPSAHVRASTLAPTHRSFSPAISIFFLAPTPSAHARLPPAHRSFSPPISTLPLHLHRPHTSAHPHSLWLARAHQFFSGPRIDCPPVFSALISILSLTPTPSARVRASTLAPAHRSFLPFPTFPLHPTHRPQMSSHPRSLLPTGPSYHLFPTFFVCTHTVHTCPRIHARSCPPVLLPTHFQPFPCTHTVRTHSLLPTGPSPLYFQPFPLHPHRPHTSAHPCWLVYTPVLLRTISILSLAPWPSAPVRST